MNKNFGVDHFEGKSALEHLLNARSRAVLATESHGVEAPSYLLACLDAARGSVILFAFLWILFTAIGIEETSQEFLLYVAAGLGWTVWKMGRFSWLNWSKLERLHRLAQQEKWEIEHNREQEKEELKELYALKGFEGELLDQVVDVLMADGDRLLRVMLEEELGLKLEIYEHPLKLGLGAGLGVLFTLIICIIATYLSFFALPIALLIVMLVAAALTAKLEGNHLISACVWNGGIGIIAFALVYFLVKNSSFFGVGL